MAETGSIRQAALDLHVSASAISRQIQNLEHGFQSALFERRPSGMYLTEEGGILALHMRRTIREMELAKARINELHDLLAGTLRYATIEGVARAWLFPTIDDFRETYPGVVFSGHIMGTEAVYEAVENDNVDFGIAMEGDPRHDIEVVRRFSTSFRAAMRNDHPLAGEEVIGLADLKPFDLTMLSAQFQTRRVLNAAQQRSGIKIRVGFELEHIELIKSQVVSTGGITILPDYAVAREASCNEMVVIDMNNEEFPPGGTLLCVRRGRELSRAASIFIEQLKQRSIP